MQHRSTYGRDNQDDHRQMEEDLRAALDATDGLSVMGIQEHFVREQYQATVREGADRIRNNVRRGTITASQGAREAHIMRNAALAGARKDSTALGRTIAEFMKSHGADFDKLLEQKSHKRFSRSHRDLTLAEIEQVHHDIIASSKSTRGSATQLVNNWAGSGAGVLAFSVLAALARLEHSHDKEEFMAQAKEEALGVAAGYSGGEVAALTARAFGAKSPLFIAVCVLLGGYVAAEEAHRYAKKHFSTSRR